MKTTMKAMMIFTLATTLTLIAITPAITNAVVVQVDIEDLSSTSRNDVLNVIKKSNSDKNASLASIDEGTVEKIEKLIPVITTGIKNICHNLGVEVNEFITTPVGTLVFGMIIYKVMAKDILVGVKDFIVIAPLYMFTTAVLLFSFRHFHLMHKRKIYKFVDKDGKEITDGNNNEGKKKLLIKELYVPGNQDYGMFSSRDAKSLSAISHVALFAISTFVAALVLIY